MHPIDQVQLNFDSQANMALQLALALVMFGVALDLSLDDFRKLAKEPRAPVVGLICQFLILPALTFPLAIAVAPSPSLALGMMLVAACPGGNVSNFLTQLAGGRVSVSVGMTAVSTVAAVFTTPFNLGFWGSMHPYTADLVSSVSLDPLSVLRTVALILFLPVVVGMVTASQAPSLAIKLRRVFKVGSLLFFAVVVVAAFAGNLDAFLAAIGAVFFPVLLLNAMALSLGYGAGVLSGLAEDQRRAIAFEVGIQNTGLGLVLALSFFPSTAGVAVVAAWWGIWHILAGFSLVLFFRWRDR